LKSADGLTELLPLVSVGYSFVERALRKAKHLSGDTDAACEKGGGRVTQNKDSVGWNICTFI
jgi:hypothetical protein